MYCISYNVHDIYVHVHDDVWVCVLVRSDYAVRIVHVEPNFDLMDSSSQLSATDTTDGYSPQPSPRMARQDIAIPGFSHEPLVYRDTLINYNV